MKLIISPAKKMVTNLNDFEVKDLPIYLRASQKLLKAMQELTYADAQALWHTSDKLTKTNYDQLQKMELTSRLTPAVLSFTGIQYQYMAPDILTAPALNYIQENLRILSGLYGILKPFDGVVPYRLEMQAHIPVVGMKNLYSFWGDRLYQSLNINKEPIINLASREYSKAIIPFLKPNDTFIDVVFGHLVNGQLKTRATLAKMARGEMVRFIAENQLTMVEDIKRFDSPNYVFDLKRSTAKKLVFIEKTNRSNK
ncbi:peroxide stress protein YaaA [Lentilactobacillus hilgardii]|uniref:peroxide stress protein YaaA n=1 Tax=Lentilactobacillus hilgardii TaxID=1588 RepID=UPI0021A8B48E|nr:peroxide stress protein YaaA [Lentilactobacillus hilgardii]MCT3398345.1 peroxide stress protein YaaA [Lentilactobacillus hilgardii]